MRLAGDIGGTKVLLALVDATGEISQTRRLASADFSTFDDLLAEYLRGVAVPIDGGCLAVAGPVADNSRSAKITNLPWVIDARQLESRFGIGHITLINDFAGVALGVATLGAAQWVTLQPGEPLEDGMKLVIGAGTGLGMAMLLGDRVLPSEGGHVGFSPQDDTQARIRAALMQEHGRVTAERVISGPGLAAIHRILAGADADPAVVAEQALAGEPAARRSVDAFLAAYGAFAGDMAMATMARGGVYLAGGIAAKILPLLRSSPFLEAFNAKAEHAGLVARMPVHVVIDPEIGLAGAALQAGREVH
jgi:glucokinase